MRRIEQRVLVGIFAAVWCGLTGCTAPDKVERTPRLSPAERMSVHTRALDQLELAAQSELPILACNAIEALTEVAPARAGRPIFRAALNHDAALVRYAGWVALGTLKDCVSDDRLRMGIRDVHPNVRLAAAFAGYRCGKQGAARLLVAALLESPQATERAEAARLMGMLEDPQAIPTLRRALEDDLNQESPRVRIAIYGAMARLGDEDALRRLVLYSRGDTAERTEALLILSELEFARVRDDLVFALLGPEEDYLEARLIAARGLGKLGFGEGYDLAYESLTYEARAAHAGEQVAAQTFAVRSLAIHALAAIGDPRALPALREIAANGENPQLQVAASYAICKILQEAGGA
jgi:HEAT repeat protein